tara:strand:+ start:46 stop:765 length:720 start_codon:yes stop_codon:yes gene_type:complete
MLNAKKSLSQNFLIDKNISKKIIAQTNLKNKIVLEIGPGYGFLTDSIILQKPKKLILVEKDNNLKEKLYLKYKNNKNIEIIGNDILKFNLNKFKNLIIISNLPYNISSKLILYLFNYNQNICEMVFMIQKEVAQKFDYNLPKMNKYKFLTKIVTNFTKCFDVSPKVFIPKPKVHSTVVKFKFNKKKYNLEKAFIFSNMIFKNVRKKIYNNIKFKINNELANKRVNQLTIDELLTIYNFF